MSFKCGCSLSVPAGRESQAEANIGILSRTCESRESPEESIAGARRNYFRRCDGVVVRPVDSRTAAQNLTCHKRKSPPREEVRQAFRKEPNSDWEEECRRSDRRALGGGVGRLKFEALREEVHCFDVLNIPARMPIASGQIAVPPCVKCIAWRQASLFIRRRPLKHALSRAASLRRWA